LELAVELFKADEVSLGRAAEIAGIDRWEFHDILHQRRIPIIIEAESAEAMDRDGARFFWQRDIITGILSTFLLTMNALTIFASPIYPKPIHPKRTIIKD